MHVFVRDHMRLGDATHVHFKCQGIFCMVFLYHHLLMCLRLLASWLQSSRVEQNLQTCACSGTSPSPNSTRWRIWPGENVLAPQQTCFKLKLLNPWDLVLVHDFEQEQLCFLMLKRNAFLWLKIFNDMRRGLTVCAAINTQLALTLGSSSSPCCIYNILKAFCSCLFPCRCLLFLCLYSHSYALTPSLWEWLLAAQLPEMRQILHSTCTWLANDVWHPHVSSRQKSITERLDEFWALWVSLI